MGSRQLTSWMAENTLSLAFTTYQTGKLFFIGLQPDGRLSIFERTFNRCMGLCADDNTLYMSSLYQLWRFENFFEEGQNHEGFDRMYVPVNGHTTGDLDIHDVAVMEDGQVVFVNTLFSCLSVLDPKHSFTPIWQPKFISKLAAEDRCHLNGLAMENGKPKYVTAVAQADVADGWRDHRQDGGCIIDVTNDEILATGLSMPHSPRVYQDKLWVLNSGTGEFGTVDRDNGKFDPVAFCPGYMRGLTFVGDYAIVGLSKARGNKTFSGLALDDHLADKKAEAQCALQIIDLKSGDIVNWLKIDGVVEELYDVVALPNAIRPMALGFKSDEIRHVISMGDAE
ncbi:MAG: TIGR03032 family protein [Rhodospirillales bacterium]|nr:TIGR03032 family protein [Rhodospirillales bacterium]MBT3905129.1 TIGR03032 family protein [Rhodospirillaceae bacterium]MBT6218819.1 TIGR03032 family protein [Rhodospirillaceae bacterium]MBT8002151.1 TIGR03032 family protein [Rhodospirillales bacterium]